MKQRNEKKVQYTSRTTKQTNSRRSDDFQLIRCCFLFRVYNYDCALVRMYRVEHMIYPSRTFLWITDEQKSQIFSRFRLAGAGKRQRERKGEKEIVYVCEYAEQTFIGKLWNGNNSVEIGRKETSGKNVYIRKKWNPLSNIVRTAKFNT